MTASATLENYTTLTDVTLRHLIRLLIDTVLDLRTLPAIPPGAG